MQEQTNLADQQAQDAMEGAQGPDGWDDWDKYGLRENADGGEPEFWKASAASLKGRGSEASSGLKPWVPQEDRAEDVGVQETGRSGSGGSDGGQKTTGGEVKDAKAGKPAPDAIRVKYNGREVEVRPEETTTYIQKGMNYDHVRSELERMRQDDGAKLLDELALLRGMDRAQYIRTVKDALENRRTAQLAGAGLPGAAAQETARRDRELASLKQFRDDQRLKETGRRKYLEFAREYPEVDVGSIPREVFEAAAGGQSYVNAYARYENKRLKEEIAALRQAGRAAQRAPGSVRGVAPPGTEDDDFAEGFNSGW